MPEPAVATPPAETPPATPPPAEKVTLVSDDPFIARIMADMGNVVKDGKIEKAPAPAPAEESDVMDIPLTTMGESARYKADRKATADAKAAEAPAPGDPPKPGEEPKMKVVPKPGETPPPAEKAKINVEKAKIKVEKAKPIEEIVEGVVQRMQASQPSPAPAPAQKAEEPKTADPDAAFIEALEPEQKEEIELAQFAAKAMPDKYANMPQRMVDYLKKVDAYIEKKQAEDPQWVGDEDEGFSSFIESNRPTYTGSDKRKLEREQILVEADARAEAKFKPQIDRAEKEKRIQELQPDIDQAAESYRAAVTEIMGQDDKSPLNPVIGKLKEKGMTEEGWQEAKSENALATTVIRTFSDRAVMLGKEYLSLVAGAKDQVAVDPKLPMSHPKNKDAMTQATLFQFIEQQEAEFAKNGGEMKVQGGKNFSTRREFNAMTPEQRPRHWVLGDNDVLDMLAIAAREQSIKAYNAEVQRRTDEGYAPISKNGTPKKEDQKATVPAKKEESPKAIVTPSPGAATPPPPQAEPTLMSSDELKHLWSGGVATKSL